MPPEVPRDAAWAAGVAAERGWTLNPKKTVVKAVIDGQNRHKAHNGEFYCPCKPPAPNTICPCEGAAAEIARDGHCHCRLFFAPG